MHWPLGIQLVCPVARTCNATELRRQPHWLPVKQCIDDNLAVLTYKARQSGHIWHLLSVAMCHLVHWDRRTICCLAVLTRPSSWRQGIFCYWICGFGELTLECLFRSVLVKSCNYRTQANGHWWSLETLVLSKYSFDTWFSHLGLVCLVLALSWVSMSHLMSHDCLDLCLYLA